MPALRQPASPYDLSKLRSFVTRSAASWLDLMGPIFFLGVYLIHPLLGTMALAAVGLLILSGVFRRQLAENHGVQRGKPQARLGKSSW